MPRELKDPLSYHDLTPEIVAARAAWDYPIPPDVIRFAQESGRLWPRHAENTAPKNAEASAMRCSAPAPHSAIHSLHSSLPPGEDCSASGDLRADSLSVTLHAGGRKPLRPNGLQ